MEGPSSPEETTQQSPEEQPSLFEVAFRKSYFDFANAVRMALPSASLQPESDAITAEHRAA